MSPASSYNGFIFYIFLSKNRRQRIFFKKMPGSALFPDEPAPQTAAKKFPEGRSPPGTEKKKHTSAAAPAKKIGERRARLSYAFPNIGQTLALLPPMVLGLIAEGNAPLPGAERKAVGTRPSASGRRGGLFAPLPCLTPPPTERGLVFRFGRSYQLMLLSVHDVLSASLKLTGIGPGVLRQQNS